MIIGFGNGFLDITPKAWSTEEKIIKLDFIKIKNMFVYQRTLLIKWEDKLQNERKYSWFPYKRLMSGIYKEHM